MFKRKKSTSLLPYIGLAIVALIIKLFLPGVEKYATIRYLPEGTAIPIIYKVEEDQIQQIGDCITFPNQKGEIITLCDHYEKNQTSIFEF